MLAVLPHSHPDPLLPCPTATRSPEQNHQHLENYKVCISQTPALHKRKKLNHSFHSGCQKKNPEVQTLNPNESFKTWTNESSQHPEAGDTHCIQGLPNSGCPISCPVYSWRLLQTGVFPEHPNGLRDPSSARARSSRGRQKGKRVAWPPSSLPHRKGGGEAPRQLAPLPHAA